MQKLILTILAGWCATLLHATPSIEKKEEQLDRKGTAVLLTHYTVNLGNGKSITTPLPISMTTSRFNRNGGTSDSASNTGGTPILPEAGVPSVSLP